MMMMLARQLVVGFLAVLVPSTVLLGGVTVYSLMSLDRLNDELVEITQSREAVADLRLTLAQVEGVLGAPVAEGAGKGRERFEALVSAARDKIRSCASASCHSSARMPEIVSTVLEPALERVRADGRLVFEPGPGSAESRAEAVRASVADMRQAVEPMLAAVRRRADELVSEDNALHRRAWTLTISLTVAIALSGSLAASVVARRISRPLADLIAGIRRIMAGDWSYRAPIAGTGEIGELAASFNTMVGELRHHRETLEAQNRTLEERVRQRTEELRRKEEALAQSERLASLGLLAAGVAHELNNPLTSIVMNVNLMLEDVGEDAQLEAELRQIDAAAARCRRIIEDLRIFARVPQVEKIPGEVGDVVDQALAAAAPELARRGVAVERDVPAGLPKVSWDADRMVQVLTNLLVNAAQAIEGGGRVAVRARSAPGALSIEVQDSGAGIPAGVRGRLFDPFFTTKADGTGLGLSISYGIVNEHGGRLEMDSRTREEAGPGEETGTTMRIVLPTGDAAA
jgi:signal transduction histidine kinase